MAQRDNRILISACLLGDYVRYDGGHNSVSSALLSRWQNEDRLVKVCPEVAGGLTTPRPPAEIQPQSDGNKAQQLSVITIDGDDVTESFVAGAKLALEVAQKHHCQFAVMAADSPSCGNRKIYDGSFTGKLIEGQGVTVDLLRQHGIQVFNQNEIEQLAALID